VLSMIRPIVPVHESLYAHGFGVIRETRRPLRSDGWQASGGMVATLQRFYAMITEHNKPGTNPRASLVTSDKSRYFVVPVHDQFAVIQGHTPVVIVAGFHKNTSQFAYAIQNDTFSSRTSQQQGRNCCMVRGAVLGSGPCNSHGPRLPVLVSGPCTAELGA